MSSYITKVKVTAASVPSAAAGKINEFVDTSDGYTKSKNESGVVEIYSGTASIAAHVAAPDPHPQYLTPAEGNAAYSPLSHVGSGGTQHANATTSVAGFMSSGDKTKLDAIGGTRKIKSGVIAAASFVGTPKKATLTFGTAFSNSNYSLSVLGGNSRSWSFESKTATDIVINANANAALSLDVLWIAIDHGESVE
jgi:hypothetical protein